jgi:hypothetical protein
MDLEIRPWPSPIQCDLYKLGPTSAPTTVFLSAANKVFLSTNKSITWTDIFDSLPRATRLIAWYYWNMSSIIRGSILAEKSVMVTAIVRYDRKFSIFSML